MKDFKIHSKFEPAGGQPQAIKKLTKGIKQGMSNQTLLGVTGSGKTFVIAEVIENIQRPTLIVAHNKTLAAQLCNEFKNLFPENAVHYFVSYYDYYQPEAYIASSDTYIEKEAMINEEIDKLRHASTAAALTRRDTIIVASVSCLYGLGRPENYKKNLIHLKKGDKIDRDKFSKKLVRLQYKRTNADLQRGKFRLRGNNWEIMPPGKEIVYDFELNQNQEIEKIYLTDPVKGFVPEETESTKEVYLPPAEHFITEKPQREKAIKKIKKELKERLEYFKKHDKPLEAERLEKRVKNDIAMIREVGFCHGIENYSRHLSGRKPGESPFSLIDYLPNDFLTVIDESHVTVPQIRGMYKADKSRKESLIKHGFRLPSAKDNRPLRFEEFKEKTDQVIYTSATPASYERNTSDQVVKQIIRPTGLVDPKIIIKPAKTQVNDLEKRMEEKIEKGDRVLITTLTKKMAEDLTDYLEEQNFNVKYLHSDVETLDRIKILTELRKGEIDIIVGVNLLREGLDLPEVSLVAILDADKEGFLRSKTSLIQVIGRAARNVEGEVVLYADEMTGSLKEAKEITERRREKQIAYNKKHGINPKTIQKDVSDIVPDTMEDAMNLENKPIPDEEKEVKELIKKKQEQMDEAAENLEFELAAALRDEIKVLKQKLDE